jgi:hypothetical protein
MSGNRLAFRSLFERNFLSHAVTPRTGGDNRLGPDYSTSGNAGE